MKNVNSDKKRGNKRSERQTREAGKFPYHRYDKEAFSDEREQIETEIKKQQ